MPQESGPRSFKELQNTRESIKEDLKEFVFLLSLAAFALAASSWMFL